MLTGTDVGVTVAGPKPKATAESGKLWRGFDLLFCCLARTVAALVARLVDVLPGTGGGTPRKALIGGGTTVLRATGLTKVGWRKGACDVAGG